MSDLIKKQLENVDDLLTIGQVAELFKIHPDTLRNWEKSGDLVPLRVGPRKDRRYRKEDIETIVAKMGSKLTLQQLEQFLWKSADILRGKIDSSDYKKYIFGLLFYKRISDVWDEEYKKVMDEYNDSTLAEADYNHRFQVPSDCKWSVIAETSENIGKRLNEIFEKITNVNSPKLDKIFDDLDFANKDRFPNETLQRLINHFSQYNFGSNYISSDLLGDAYEYLIKQFAADAGKKGGEFYTPREVERIIIGILKPHQKDKIYDPTVGSGGFLLEAYSYLRNKTNEQIARTLYLYGQELNIGTFAIAKINMFLHGLDSADIRRGDTLAYPQFSDNLGRLQTFDIVVSNPPYSIKDWEHEMFNKDSFKRTEGYVTPPDKNADFAFILHIIKSLNSNGRAGIVLPHGVLFRPGNEAKIREKIITEDLIEGIIGLPPKLFYGTPIPAVIMILNKNKPEERKNKIIFINADEDFEKGKKQNYLRAVDVEKIVKSFNNFEPIERYANIVDLDNIRQKEFFLNIGKYVDTSKKEEIIDLVEVRRQIETTINDLERTRVKVSELLKNRSTHIKWKILELKDILFEHKTHSNGDEEVYSVSVKKGLVNQIEHLGRSFSSKDTSKYKVVKPWDVVYTKSPTGEFPYGIIKQSYVNKDVIVSPLYGVFTPKTRYIGILLDAFFESPINANNYLRPLVSKGAKNTINISNDKFLSMKVYLPEEETDQQKLAEIIEAVRYESQLQDKIAELFNKNKHGQMQLIFQDVFQEKN